MPERQVITSLTGTAAPLLTLNAANRTELDYGSMFLPREWKKSTPFVTDFQRIHQTSGNGLGTEISWQIPKMANIVLDMILEASFPGNTVTPAGTAVSYIDWTGLSFWSKFEAKFGANTVYERRPYDIYFHIRKEEGIERLESTRKQLFGDTTTAQREQLLLQGNQGNPPTPLLVNFHMPFCDDVMQCLPLTVLSQKICFTLHTKPLASFVTNPLAATITPQGAFTFDLLLQVAHLTGREADVFLEMSRSPSGIAYMMHQNIREDYNDYASTADNFIIQEKLLSICKPIMSLTWAMIPTRLVNDTGFNDLFFFKPDPPAPVPRGMNPYNPPKAWEITANSLTIQRYEGTFYTKFRMYDIYEHAFAGEDVYAQNYAYWPHAVNAATGYLDYSNLCNPTLNIYMSTGGTGIDPLNPTQPQSVRVIVNALDYNFWFFKGGNWTRCFN